MENDDFANVSWQRDKPAQNASSGITSPISDTEGGIGGGNSNGKRRGSGGPLGRDADALDLAGVGDATLECTVTTPIKENDGTKDAYVSYLVVTHVGSPLRSRCAETNQCLDEFPLLPESYNISPQTIYGLCVPLQDPLARVSSMCCSAVT